MSDLLESEVRKALSADQDLQTMAKFFKAFDPSKELLTDKLRRMNQKALNPPEFLRCTASYTVFTGRVVYSDKMSSHTQNVDELKIWKRALARGDRVVGLRRKRKTIVREPVNQKIREAVASMLPTLGRIWIVRSGKTRSYKFLWIPKKGNVQDKLEILQGGNPTPLKVVGNFPSTSRKALHAIAEIHANKTKGNSWFQLTKSEIKLLLSSEWRQQHSIF